MEQEDSKFLNFTQKLSIILQDPTFSRYIRLKQAQQMIQIQNPELFASQVLPLFFRHNKLQSFFRQMTTYGFKKIRKSQFHTFFHAKLKKGVSVETILNKTNQKKQERKRRYKQKRQLKLKQKMEKQENKERQKIKKQVQIQPINKNQKQSPRKNYARHQQNYNPINSYFPLSPPPYIPWFADPVSNYFRRRNPFYL